MVEINKSVKILFQEIYFHSGILFRQSCKVQVQFNFPSNSSTSEVMEYLCFGNTKENCFSFSQFYSFQFVRNSIFGSPIVEQKTISPTWSISCLPRSDATSCEENEKEGEIRFSQKLTFQIQLDQIKIILSMHYSAERSDVFTSKQSLNH